MFMSNWSKLFRNKHTYYIILGLNVVYKIYWDAICIFAFSFIEHLLLFFKYLKKCVGELISIRKHLLVKILPSESLSVLDFSC